MSSKRTREDLERLLEEELQFIEASADSFDRGFEGEAKRLATTIRVLCHDTAMSRSLLGQLDLKQSTRFPDTAEPCTPPVSDAFAGLVRITQNFEKGSWYIAPLDDGRDAPTRTFDEWWNGAVFILPREQLLSRAWLVKIAANQDGGAHVDPELDERYRRIFDGLGWEYSIDDAPQKLNQIELVSLRQIAHELLKALRPAYGRQQTNVGLVISTMAKFYYHGDTTSLAGWRPTIGITRPDGSSVFAMGPRVPAPELPPLDSQAASGERKLSNATPGPYVTALLLCEKILREETGVYSVIRVIDYASEDASMPVPMSEELKKQFHARPFATNSWLYISVFPDAPGTHELRIRPVYEDGMILNELVSPIEFQNDSDGVTFAVELRAPFPKPGRIWIEAWIDGVFKTRSRFTLRRSLREGAPNIPNSAS